jgi:hypothetical protein
MAKITYLCEGEAAGSARIGIDGEYIDSSNFANLVSDDVHAIQWDGTNGEIEYKDGRGNTTITDISSYGFETAHANEKQAIADAETLAITNRTYEEKREIEYPEVVDQLDDIYHNGLDGWKATIKAIKDKYPKV